jgi:hypothetical protein
MNKQGGMDRRQFLEITLKGFVSAAAGAAAASIPVADQIAQGLSALSPEDSESLEQQQLNLETELKQIAIDMVKQGEMTEVDFNTATLMAGTFAAMIVGALTINLSLDEKTAFVMNALAMHRRALLRQSSNPRDHELAEQEAHHHMFDMAPAALLALISDLTTNEEGGLRVNLEAIFQDSLRQRSVDLDGKMRPRLEFQSVELWKEYLGKAKADLRTEVQRLNMVGFLAAPLASTYSPSAVANVAKENVARLLFEMRYAELVIKNLYDESGQIDEQNLMTGAANMVNEDFNGKFGYNKLLLATDCNAKGTTPPLGDPPEVFYLIDILSDPEVTDPGQDYMTNFAFGLSASLVSSLVTNNLYLMKVGAFSLEDAFKFIPDALNVIEKAMETVASSRLRQASLGSNKNIKEQLLAELAKSDGGAKEIVDLLNKMPDVCFEFQGLKYLENKLKAIHIILTKLPSYLAKYVPLWGQLAELALEKSSQTSYGKDIVDKLGDLEKLVLGNAVDHNATGDQLGSELAGMFSELRAMSQQIASELERKINLEQNSDEATIQLDDATKQRIAKRLKLNNEIRSFLLRQDQDELQSLSVETKALVGITSKDDPEQIRKKIQAANDTILGKALAKYSLVQGATDDVPGLDSEEHEHHSSGIASHAAKEVLFALLTQIPVVAPLQHLIVDAVTPAGKTSFTDEEIQSVARLTSVEGLNSEESLKKMKSDLLGFIEKLNGRVAPDDEARIDLFLSESMDMSKADKGKRILDIVIKSSKTITPKRLKEIIWGLLCIDSGMSSVADNVAAFLMTKGCIETLMKQTFGENTFKKRPKTKRWTKILTKFVAELGGALSRIGNGPNFSQEKIVLSLTDDLVNHPQGIKLDRIELPFAETAYHNNGYALLLNGLGIIGAGLYFQTEIDALADSEVKLKQAA